MKWFKNATIYKFTRPFTAVNPTFETTLSTFEFRPCAASAAQSFGWTPPLGKQGNMVTHPIKNNFLICARKEEKLLPAFVVKDAVAQRVAAKESQTGKPVERATRLALKDDVMAELLPKAFSRITDIQVLIMPVQGLLIVDTANSTKAEEVLALLRKSLGSLAVVPLSSSNCRPIYMALTEWVKTEAPHPFDKRERAEFENLENASVMRCANQDLEANEIHALLDSCKVVKKMEMEYSDQLIFQVNQAGTLSNLKFSTQLKAFNAERVNDDENDLARIDADCHLMSNVLVDCINELYQAINKDHDEAAA